MTIPEFAERQKHLLNPDHMGRHGYYRTAAAPPETPAPPKAGTDAHGSEGDGEAAATTAAPPRIDKGKAVDRGDAPAPPAPPKPPAATGKLDARSFGPIQVMDLHSAAPLISYRGRVFKGSWAQNLGTEMLLADHGGAHPPLPALRTLKGDVDVLGASAARILTSEVKLVPRDGRGSSAPERPDQLARELAAIRERERIRVPIFADKTGERKEQARFLENLQALKRKKGEADEVTFFAQAGAGEDMVMRRRRFLGRRQATTAPETGGRGRGSATNSPRRGRGTRGARGDGGGAEGRASRRVTFEDLVPGEMGDGVDGDNDPQGSRGGGEGPSIR